MTLAASIYAETLSYRGHGLALWIPEPSKSGQVQIGDVGYVNKGGFYRLFNVTYPANDAINQDGTPPYFEVLHIDPRHKHTLLNYLPPGPLCSRSVRKVDVDCEASSETIAAEASYRFKCSEDSGALLVLKDYATLEEVHQGHVLEKYIRKHHANWWIYARDICGLSVDPEAIMLVKGCFKTSEWVVAAFLDKGTEHEISLRVGAEPFAKAKISVSVSSSTSMSVEYRVGPLAPYALPVHSTDHSRVRDQTVFISGYRLRRRFALPSKLLAAAGHEVDDDPRLDGDDPKVTDPDGNQTDRRVDVYEYPSPPQFKDPADDILNYILENSNADVAIASHPYWRELIHVENADTENCSLAALLKSGHHVVVDETNTGTLQSAPGTASLPTLEMKTTSPAPPSIPPVDRRKPKPISYRSSTESDDPADIARAFPPLTYQGKSPPPISLPSSKSSRISPLVLSHTLPSVPEVQLSLPYTCIFRDIEPFCMTLGPADHAPLYRIDVRPNCFMPTSYITTVSRGAGGELVARFEMGLSRDRPMLYMDQRTMPLDEVFVNYRKVDSKLRGRWKWIRAGYTLQWDCRNELEAVCFHDADKEKTPLARLFPAPSVLLDPHAAQPPVTKLEVRTPYMDLLDEIVISALIVERKRQTPFEGSQNKELFNYTAHGTSAVSSSSMQNISL